MLSFDQLALRIDQLKDYILDLQKNMTKRVAIAPPEGDGEMEKATYLEEQLRTLAFDEIKRLDVPDDRVSAKVRPNLIAKYYGVDKSRTLWLLAHMDVVPAGDLTAWKTNPFEVTVDADGDTIYGKGEASAFPGKIFDVEATFSGDTMTGKIVLPFMGNKEIPILDGHKIGD